MAPPPAATSTGESSLTEGTGTAQDELTQTIDHMNNASNQPPKTTMEKDIKSTSNQTGKSFLEKTVDKNSTSCIPNKSREV